MERIPQGPKDYSNDEILKSLDEDIAKRSTELEQRKLVVQNTKDDIAAMRVALAEKKHNVSEEDIRIAEHLLRNFENEVLTIERQLHNLRDERAARSVK